VSAFGAKHWPYNTVINTTSGTGGEMQPCRLYLVFRASSQFILVARHQDVSSDPPDLVA
jgi:hypothetical protein